MKSLVAPTPSDRVLLTLVALALATVSRALAAESTAASASKDRESETVVLSPFQVDVSKDKGYRATNSISGSRLNTPIKNIPMPIEVITEEFVKDTGSKDLRESLRYSAGIVLQSQNDAGQGNTFVNAGGVHSTEGATAAKTQTTVKLRGFITDSTLRDGFRRQHSSDSANIGRIEVVRGPAALLYGIGNFGGIVNYLPKTPLAAARDSAYVGVGSNNFFRTAFDTSRPASSNRLGLAYRVNGAVERRGDQTELFENDHYFVAPVVQWRPFQRTLLTLDLEYGEEFRTGTGFQSVRARADVPASQQDRLERAGFLRFDGKDRRTFRWSGPDTYLDTKAYNVVFKVEQRVGENLNLMVGTSTSMSRFKSLDVGGALQVGVGPTALRSTIYVEPLTPEDSAYSAGFVNNTVFQYGWTRNREKNNREQVRAEANYKLDLFKGRNRWLASTHNFLAGQSIERADKKTATDATQRGGSNYKSPTDSSYIRFGVQGDGTPDVPMSRTFERQNLAWNQGLYGVYQGTLLNERLTLVGGGRRDRNANRVLNRNVQTPSASTLNERAPQTKSTGQYGASVRITRQLSAFALRSEGLVPNFEGLVDGNGSPIDATLARSKEIGLKLDFFNGRLSGTISRFKIERTGTPYFYWWSPAPAKRQFDPTRDIVYLVAGANPVEARTNLPQQNALAEWNSAVSAGAAFQRDGKWYLNASRPQGAAYMDKVYANVAAGQGWPGWYFNITDPHVNNATMDRAAPDRGTYKAWNSGDDESEGWDAQILFSPSDSLQLLVTFARLERRTINVGKFPKYPYPEDRWANWFFPDGSWGLTGHTLQQAYTDPTDSSTWTGAGYLGKGTGDDSPKHAGSFWGNYNFRHGKLKGLAIGVGGQYEGQREFQSPLTDGAGQLQVDKNGNQIALYTKQRVSFDFMARYEFPWRERQTRVQLNLYNVLNDRDQYGLGYAPGISGRVELGFVW